MSGNGQQSLGVVEFYHNSTILIVGGTGFLGQILLEKILRSLQPKKVYLLIREKRGQTVDQRLDELLSGRLFNKVRITSLKEKLRPLEVDFTKDNLSLNDDQREELANEVDVVFYLLASVHFNQRLDRALQINLEYARRVYSMPFQHLKAVVHVSTMYANSDQRMIEEKIYEEEIFGGYQNLKRILDELTPSEIKQITPHILRGLPNTYTFSKKCAELMVQEEFGDLPFGIFRPPIISSSYQDPVVGWTNNLNGFGAFVSGIYTGELRILPIDVEKHPFIAPVDYCANAMLCCAVDLHRRRDQYSSFVPVYNYAFDNPELTWGRFFNFLMDGLPPVQRYVNGYLLMRKTKSPKASQLCYSIRRLEGLVSDVFARLLRGDQTKHCLKVAEQSIWYAESMKFFSLNDWHLQNDNFCRVLDALDSAERQMFGCDLRQVDWKAHVTSIAPGVIEFMEKGDK
ncbi:fatty acyl-CoA reductase wat-like [Uranotaenia lowii]|uniref:fatty acyl-CoA reductase wat-like n=1 Tax=Uranotaenia lowii TaxID=190385 RepID=UPI0024785694|nr:fatty acyl-CoA reductase wat-like [Uranotaenia lowii]